MRKFICSVFAFIMVISTVIAYPTTTVSAAGSSQSGLILSANSIAVTEGNDETFTAALPIGYDATSLACVVADSDIVTVIPVAYAENVSGFAISYVGEGSTVVAVYNIDNPAMVAYLTVEASKIVMDIPSKLGTNKDNYCVLTSYEFVPYDFTYQDFNDYKYTLNIKYQCKSYEDTDFNKWGCYGYFYDAEGNIIKKVHLYAGTLTKGRTYHSEFDVPVNAVKFSIEGFN